MSNNGKTIEIVVSPTGEATVQTRGFAGPSCRDASRFLEQALGERAGEHLTSEFYHAQAAERQTTRQG